MGQSVDFCQTCGDMIDAAEAGTCYTCFHKQIEEAKLRKLHDKIDNILLSDEVKDEKEEWIVDCGACGSKSEVGWKQAIEDGCPVCCSFKISIYHRKNL